MGGPTRTEIAVVLVAALLVFAWPLREGLLRADRILFGVDVAAAQLPWAAVVPALDDPGSDGAVRRPRNPSLADQGVCFYPFYVWVAESWCSGDPPLWNPLIYAGAPGVGNPQAGALDPAAVASMGIVAAAVKQACGLPIGINALRNDARAAMGIAAATGAGFIRVNVHTGVAATDQGMIEGRASDTLRYRRLLGIDVAILADVHVKHARPVSQPDIAEAARDCAYRGHADALIVSGVATGAAADLACIEQVRKAVPDRRLFVGSGATVETIGGLLERCDGAIVGTHLKVGGETAAPVEAERARAFIRAARG